MSILSHDGRRTAFEWPNGLLILAIYGAWAALVWFHARLPMLLADAALVVVVAWFMSLQHELLHGHPTRHDRLNRLFGLLPLAVWYPYDLYRDSHLAHHQDELLTTPGVDPESNYVDAATWQAMSPARRWLQAALRTVLGRLVLGPLVAVPMVWAGIGTALRQGDGRAIRMWTEHLLLLGLLLWWLQAQCGIGPLHYLLGIAWPALGLAMLRSFYEHRPAREVGHRIVINEAGWFWRLLYLNNNYHAVHHAVPGLPWYRIPALWRAQRERFLAGTGGFHLDGYGSLIARHLLRPVDGPVHPGFGDAPRPEAEARPAQPPARASVPATTPNPGARP